MAVLVVILLAQAGGLNWAVKHGDIAAARAFLAAGADPNYEDNFLARPLHWAVVNNRADLVALLLNSGAKPDVPSYNYTPLQIAVLNNRADIAAMLLDRNANVNAGTGDGGVKVSDYVVVRGYTQAPDPLVDSGGLTPLELAVSRDYVALAKFLIARGADVRTACPGEGTPLHAATRYASPELARLLLEKGADPNARDEKGLTPLVLAVVRGRGQIAALLVDAGAKVPNEMLAQAVLKGRQDVLELLLRRDANVNVHLASGSTLLHDAALKGYDGIVTLLLAHRANVDIHNASGATPLHDAALNGKAATAGILLDHGAEINARETESGITALYAGASLGREDVVALLLDRGADPNIASNRGASPLHAAIEGGSQAIAERIRARGGRDLH